MFWLRMNGNCRHGPVCVLLEVQMDGQMHRWMEEVGVVGGGKGEMRVIKGGNMGQNLARKAKELVGRRDEWSKD